MVKVIKDIQLAEKKMPVKLTGIRFCLHD